MKMKIIGTQFFLLKEVCRLILKLLIGSSPKSQKTLPKNLPKIAREFSR